MDPPFDSDVCGLFRFPRTRGDGPDTERLADIKYKFPPHPRGWTPTSVPRRRPQAVSPAPAGMDPSGRWEVHRQASFPRTRGDGPPLPLWEAECTQFPPHPRGWTPPAVGGAVQVLVSPAPAGMDPPDCPPSTLARCFPRTRGDGPRPRGCADAHLAGLEILLAGDVEVAAQADLGPIRADVLKVPHQGAATSDRGWLEASAGRMAVISVGPNDYGHPSAWVIEALEGAGATVLRTDRDGDVVIRPP